MGEFTNNDRERAQKTLTLLEQHIKQSDERHTETKAVLSRHDERIDEHDKRIGKGENFRYWLIGGIGFSGLGAGAALLKVFGI